MMQAAPPSPFVVTETDLLLELLIVALDAPAQLGQVDQLVDCDVLPACREPVFGRLRLVAGPLDEEPFLGMTVGRQMAMRNMNPHAREARGQHVARALAPL